MYFEVLERTPVTHMRRITLTGGGGGKGVEPMNSSRCTACESAT